MCGSPPESVTDRVYVPAGPDTVTDRPPDPEAAPLIEVVTDPDPDPFNVNVTGLPQLTVCRYVAGGGGTGFGAGVVFGFGGVKTGFAVDTGWFALVVDFRGGAADVFGVNVFVIVDTLIAVEVTVVGGTVTLVVVPAAVAGCAESRSIKSGAACADKANSAMNTAAHPLTTVVR